MRLDADRGIFKRSSYLIHAVSVDCARWAHKPWPKAAANTWAKLPAAAACRRAVAHGTKNPPIQFELGSTHCQSALARTQWPLNLFRKYKKPSLPKTLQPNFQKQKQKQKQTSFNHHTGCSKQSPTQLNRTPLHPTPPEHQSQKSNSNKTLQTGNSSVEPPHHHQCSHSSSSHPLSG